MINTEASLIFEWGGGRSQFGRKEGLKTRGQREAHLIGSHPSSPSLVEIIYVVGDLLLINKSTLITLTGESHEEDSLREEEERA